MLAAITDVFLDPLMDGLEWVGDQVRYVAEGVGRWVLWALVHAINGLILAVGESVEWVLAQLPQLPAQPGVPAVVGYVNWVAPVGALVGIFGAMLTLYIVWLGLSVLARWVKAL